jgi:hypothetical protein
MANSNNATTYASFIVVKVVRYPPLVALSLTQSIGAHLRQTSQQRRGQTNG